MKRTLPVKVCQIAPISLHVCAQMSRNLGRSVAGRNEAVQQTLKRLACRLLALDAIQMHQVFKRILCPIDFDASSAKALELAASLASQNGARLSAIHVISIPASSFGYPIRPYESLARIEQEHLKVFVRTNVPANISCETFVKIGDAKHEILAAADEGNVDLIVMASRRRSGIPRLVLGSVAEGVLHGSNRPVLIVRPETP